MSDKQGNVPQFSDYEKELLLDGGWQCSFCERVNANYVGSCACGHNKKDSDLNRLGLYEEYVEKTGQKLETPAAQMASAEEAKEDAASVETTVSQPAQPEPEAPKPVKNKYIYEDTELGEYEQDLIDDGGWQCGFCRRINAYYITSCACGHNKDDSDLKHLGKYVDPEDEYYEDDEYYEEEDEVAATETTASQPVTPQAVPTQATVSQAAHTATPVQSGAQPQARPVQPQAQAVQPQASVQLKFRLNLFSHRLRFNLKFRLNLFNGRLRFSHKCRHNLFNSEHQYSRLSLRFKLLLQHRFSLPKYSRQLHRFNLKFRLSQ